MTSTSAYLPSSHSPPTWNDGLKYLVSSPDFLETTHRPNTVKAGDFASINRSADPSITADVETIPTRGSGSPLALKSSQP